MVGRWMAVFANGPYVTGLVFTSARQPYATDGGWGEPDEDDPDPAEAALHSLEQTLSGGRAAPTHAERIEQLRAWVREQASRRGH